MSSLLDLAVRVGIDDQASGKIGGIANGIKSALGTAAKAAGVAAAAVGAATTAMVGASLNSFGEYEQLVGGVQKLYGNAGQSVEEFAAASGKAVEEVQEAWARNDRAQQIVFENARQAYRTAGMDMSTYMQNATSFSASLINSLGGDTEEAARLTDVAMRAISDNVNTFGSDMGSVTMAFQGFAKGQYAMLDNLKLGYGGTKEEMERLIEDANAWGEANGKASDLSIDSFADVVTAIDYIQQKQQIANTTAKEAAGTIQGSLGMAKAAWENLLTGIADPDLDLSSLMTDLFDSLGAVAENVLPRVGAIFQGLGEAIPLAISAGLETLTTEVGPKLQEKFQELADNATGPLAAVFQGLSDAFGNVGGFIDQISGAFDGFRSTMETTGDAGQALKGFLDDLAGAFGIASGYTSAFSEAVGGTVSIVQGLVGQLVGFVQSNLPMFEEIGGKMSEIAGIAGDILGGAFGFLGDVIGTVMSIVLDLASSALPMVSGALDLIIGVLEWLQPMLEGLWGTLEIGIGWLQSLYNEIAPAIQEAFTYIGEILTTVGQYFSDAASGAQEDWQALQDWLAGVPDAIVNFFTSLPENIQAKFEDLRAKAQEKVESLRSWISGIPAAIVAFFANIGSDVQAKFEDLRSKVQSKMEEVKGNVRDKWNGIKQGMLDMASQAKTSVVDKFGELKQGVSDKFQQVIDYVRGIPGKISGALGDLGSLLWQAGSSIISGLKEGMVSAFSSVTSWVSGIAGTIASLKGPLPYDRTVLIPNGLALMDSLETGLKSGFEGKVGPYVSSMAERISDGMQLSGGVKANGIPVESVSGGWAASGGVSNIDTTSLEDEVRMLREDVRNLSIYLDGKALVGGIVGDMDKSLGRRQLAAARGF